MSSTIPRLCVLTADVLDAEQRLLWNLLTSVRAEGEQTDNAGGLVGPFNAFLHAPQFFTKLMPAGTFLRNGTVLERRLVELAICSVAAHWRAEFEFWQHRPLAIEHGIEPAIVEDLRVDRAPRFEREDERAVHAFTSQIIVRQRVADDAYSSALKVLGERGVVELIAVIGFYTLIAVILNVFEVGTPDQERVFAPQAEGDAPLPPG